MKDCGARRGVERSWYEFANEYRRRALRRMIGAVDPAFNIDDVHREVLDGLLTEERIDAFSPEDRREITQRWHELDTWPDFAAALVRLRARYVCVSFTILSLSLVIDSARRNNIVWDAVMPCEMLRVYKTRPEAYRLAAKYLAVSPGDILRERTPAVPIRRSVHRNYVVCLECGWRGLMLRRHLNTGHGLTVGQYRARWNLPREHPMTAPGHSERRSDLAKWIGLGRGRRASREEPEPVTPEVPAAAQSRSRRRRGRPRSATTAT